MMCGHGTNCYVGANTLRGSTDCDYCDAGWWQVAGSKRKVKQVSRRVPWRRY